MIKIRKVLTSMLVMLLTILTVFSHMPAQAARKPTVVPKVQFATAPVTEYKVGDRVGFNIYSPNYGGKVEYRVVLWNDSTKSYSDLWNSYNGYPTRYYTKWQPNGNSIFTLGWIINEPGSYRITVYAKRVGVPSSKAALKGMNCDSYMESVAFRVKPRTVAVQSILPVADVAVNQYATPTLPVTVKALMNDGTEKYLRVTWGTVDTTRVGTFTIQGSVEGTTLKASLRLTVNPVSTTLNVYSVEAGSLSTVNVNLRESIGFTPDLSRFSLSGYVNGYGVSNIRIYTLNMSTDRKIIQLSTDTLALGSWYTLKVDGREYMFQVSYNGSGYGNRVTITARDITVPVTGSVTPDITVYPYDAALSYTSSDATIARYNSYTGKIEGLKPGYATFYVTASKTGYTSASTTFRVTVGGSSRLTASPEVLYEAVANDGSLVSNLITLTSPYDYFRSTITKDDVLITGLPLGMGYEIANVTTNVLTIRITGKALSHANANDKLINIKVYNYGLYGYTDYLTSNDVLINFSDNTITGIDPIADINKPIGTVKADLGLPVKVNVTLDNGAKSLVDVTWDNGTPTYNPNQAGEYVFKGTVTLPTGVTNPGNHKAQVKVVLTSEPMDVVAEDFGVMTDSGVMGYTVGFGFVNAKASDVSSVIVNLYKGSTKLATNISKNVLKNYPTATSLSAPFDVFGDFDYAADGNWTYSGWNASKASIPTKAEIIVTFKNGTVKVATNTLLSGDTGIFTKGDVVAEDFSVFNGPVVVGYNVGFRLIDATAKNVESIVVTLYKDDKFLARNTMKDLPIQYPDAAQLSAPFDVLGDFDYEADGCWTYSGWKGSSIDIPNKAVIKVTFKNGIVKTVTNTTLTGNTRIFMEG